MLNAVTNTSKITAACDVQRVSETKSKMVATNRDRMAIHFMAMPMPNQESKIAAMKNTEAVATIANHFDRKISKRTVTMITTQNRLIWNCQRQARWAKQELVQGLSEVMARGGGVSLRVPSLV